MSVTGIDKASILRRQLAADEPLRIFGAHDGMTARIGEQSGFGAVWASGLGISATYALPDAGILSLRDFLDGSIQMDRATSIPIIADCDGGFGDVNVIEHMVRSFEAGGIAAVCIEDKPIPKRNSFHGEQQLADIDEFAAKILASKQVQRTTDFLVLARLEALIAGAGMEEAVRRADAYVAAGADAIVIHSKRQDAVEVLEFAAHWRDIGRPRPLLAIPTTYPSVTAAQLHESGVDGIIYANQALRACLSASRAVAEEILEHNSSQGCEAQIATVRDVFDLIGMTDLSDRDRWFEHTVAAMRQRSAPVAVPARPS